MGGGRDKLEEIRGTYLDTRVNTYAAYTYIWRPVFLALLSVYYFPFEQRRELITITPHVCVTRT